MGVEYLYMTSTIMESIHISNTIFAILHTSLALVQHIFDVNITVTNLLLQG
jgi:hypothetical protein